MATEVFLRMDAESGIATGGVFTEVITLVPPAACSVPCSPEVAAQTDRAIAMRARQIKRIYPHRHRYQLRFLEENILPIYVISCPMSKPGIPRLWKMPGTLRCSLLRI